MVHSKTLVDQISIWKTSIIFYKKIIINLISSYLLLFICIYSNNVGICDTHDGCYRIETSYYICILIASFTLLMSSIDPTTSLPTK